MNNLPSSSSASSSSAGGNRHLDEPYARNDSNETGNKAQPQMRSSNDTDTQTRGEKRLRTDEMQVDSDEASTEPDFKVRRVELASDVWLIKKTKQPEKSLLEGNPPGNPPIFNNLHW